MGQLTAADEGKQVTVQGTVVGTENFSVGFKLHVNDTTAQLVVTVWDDDWDYVYDSYRINIGAVVRVTGKVNVYRGQLEIMPDWGRQVEVIKPARRDEIVKAKSDLGRLTGNDHNALVWVEGVIADIQPFDSGAMLLLQDDTGAQKVRLYDVVAQRIPRKELLWKGQRVSVTGRVRARRRAGIEIVVALPHDVYVQGASAGARSSQAGAAAASSTPEVKATPVAKSTPRVAARDVR
jgi:DNA/RNA endonuclease YhcR with UshA esterase domain